MQPISNSSRSIEGRSLSSSSSSVQRKHSHMSSARDLGNVKGQTDRKPGRKTNAADTGTSRCPYKPSRLNDQDPRKVKTIQSRYQKLRGLDMSARSSVENTATLSPPCMAFPSMSSSPSSWSASFLKRMC